MDYGKKLCTDDYKGLLIILVVIAHAYSDTAYNVIFLFYMPLFFALTGGLYHRINEIQNIMYFTSV